MASLVACPVEIVHMIIGFMPKSSKDLASLALVNIYLNIIVTEELYRWIYTSEPHWRETDSYWRTVECRRPLHWAAYVGRIGAAHKFLDRGANPNSYWFFPRSGECLSEFLISSISRPQYSGELFEDRSGKVLVNRSAPESLDMDIDRQFHSYPALSNLEASPPAREIQYAVQQKDYRMTSLWTPLHLAVREGHLEVVELLISRRANLNMTSKGACGCRSPFYLSCANKRRPLSAVLGDPDLTRLLLNHGASVSFRNLLKALKKSDLISAELIYDNLYPKPRSVAEIQRMFRVTWESDPAVLGFVLALDKDRVIIQDQRSVSRMLSCARSNPKSVLLLLESGAQCDDVSTPGGGGAIYWAVSHSRSEEVIQKLLAAGANPDMIRTGGQNTCALYEAVSFGDRNKRRTYVKLLVDHGANVNAILDEISNSNAPQQLFGKTFITPFRRSLSSLAHRGVTSIGRFVPNFVDREVVEIMLHSKSMQSWNDELKAIYAAEAIQNGSVKLLESLMALGAADVVNQRLIHTALNYELRRLQQISKSPGSFDQMNDSIEMIAFLSRNGADWNYRGEESMPGLTSQELLYNAISTAKSAYQRLLLRAKSMLEAETTNVIFLNENETPQK
ncbi:hypothetical protein PG989_001599 [Apiospora arundinis]